jgi:hypothetical protein
MQKVLITFLSITTVALGVVCSVQWRQLRQQQARQADLERTLRQDTQSREEQAATMRELEARADRLQQDVQEFSAINSNLRSNESMQRSKMSALAERVKSSQKNAGSDPAVSGKNMRDMVSTMMKNPEMRKVIRGQQKAMIDVMYAGLFKQLQLGPEEKTELSELLLNAQMRRVEGAQGMFGESDAQDLEQARLDFAQAKKELETQVKDLLGDERYGEYREYQKNVTERMQINQLQTQLESSQMPLQDQQVAQLMQLMQDEKTKVPPVFPSDSNISPAETKALMTAENIEKQFQWMDDYNKRVLTAAAAVLSPEQLQKFRELQEQQASMQKTALKMAKELFGQQPAAVP